MTLENLKVIKFPPIEGREILRQSTNGRVMVVETTSNQYAVLQDGAVLGIYHQKNDAFLTFGILTRAMRE
jgi:hypothetical protein